MFDEIMKNFKKNVLLENIVGGISGVGLGENNDTNQENKDKIKFWFEDPNIIFNQKYIFEFFPTQNMTFEQKLNSLSRLIILLTIISFVFYGNYRILVISAITLVAVWFMYYYKNKNNNKKEKETKENFEDDIDLDDKGKDIEDVDEKKTLLQNVLSINNIDVPKNVFDTPTDTNPFSNVLMTDYDYNPKKKPAPPCYNDKISNKILNEAKQLISNTNPDQPDIADKLFRDLGEQFVFEQSMHSFHTNPSTTIPNDQGGFAEFCYGNMISCKEGNMFACARNLSRYQN